MRLPGSVAPFQTHKVNPSLCTPYGLHLLQSQRKYVDSLSDGTQVLLDIQIQIVMGLKLEGCILEMEPAQWRFLISDE
jgi:hypothetical protein